MDGDKTYQSQFFYPLEQSSSYQVPNDFGCTKDSDGKGLSRKDKQLIYPVAKQNGRESIFWKIEMVGIPYHIK